MLLSFYAMYGISTWAGAQFVIATHSPILLTYPGAALVSCDGATLRSVSLEDTSHYQITRGILEHPERYWKHLGRGDVDD